MDSLNENTYIRLKNDIMRFVLTPGTRISAQTIAEKYGVSRTPAREAIIKLQKEGLLYILPKSGTYVARINLDRANQEWFVRAQLEMGMAEAFINNCTQLTIKELKNKLSEMQNFSKYNAEKTMVDYDNEFHSIMYRCSKQLLACEIIETQMTHYNRIRYLSMLSAHIAAKVDNEHLALIDAAAGKDAYSFKKILKGHIYRIENEQKDLRKLYCDYFD